MSNAEIFTRIFRNCEWNGDGVSTSVSGPGSTPTAAKTYVDLVLSFIKENGITSVVDIGHGDWFMWPDEAFRGITYTGFDVVEELCLNNTTKFGSETIKFVNQDATKVDLPTGDLILIKDVLGHLSLVDIQTILSKASRFKFIIINEGFSKIYVKDWVIIVRRVLQLRRRIRIIKQGGVRLSFYFQFSTPFYLMTIKK